MNGTLNVADGRFVLRFEHWLAHPPEKVWAALTDPAAKNRLLAPEVAKPLRLSSVHGKLPVGLVKGTQS